ncbi:MAG: glycosyltransferase [Coriobacteriia bacterium]|nr:glycosyltransferase [Coriobacteriia bacterium]MBN2823369.1 glycosyltransferase [Coriobacteriia bacterium]
MVDEGLAGITFSKQFPGAVEPLRGTFVAQQMLATSARVRWGVIAPVPWVPRWLAPVLKRPYVRGADSLGDARIERPRYPVLPRRLLYRAVAPAMARFAGPAFSRMVTEVAPMFVHAHGIYPSGSAARSLCAEHDLPLVLSVHGSDLYSNLARDSWAAEVRTTVAAAEAIVCVSGSLARDVIALAGADPRRVTVVPNTFDTARFHLLERRRIPTLRLVSVGRLVPEKGFDLLLEAVSMLVKRGMDVSLVLVGAGAEERALRELVAELGLEARVRLVGSQGDERLVECLRDADIFVSSSRREGFGVAILEALATGLPVVATRAGGPEDFVGPEDGVLVVVGNAAALADGIEAVSNRLDGLDSAAISRRAHSTFAPEVVAARLVHVYEQVVSAAQLGEDA